MNLEDIGWDAGIESRYAAVAGDGTRPGRVSRIDRGICTVLSPAAERATTVGQPVAVGDWVAVGPGVSTGDLPMVQAIVERVSAFLRHRPGDAAAAQVVAANVDALVVAVAADSPLNPGRIERYLSLAWQSGATPTVALTKGDAVSPGALGAMAEGIGAVAPDVAVCPVSVRTGDGIDRLRAMVLGKGRTAALVGPSGVGKSSLLNRLVGAEAMATAATRRDGKGRHTTSHRELVVVDGGGVLIDTPGMRALGMWEAEEGVAQAFAEIEALAAGCRFADCSHAGEPGCAVAQAVASGALDPARLEHWRKLSDELHDVADRREAARRASGEPGRTRRRRR